MRQFELTRHICQNANGYNSPIHRPVHKSYRFWYAKLKVTFTRVGYLSQVDPPNSKEFDVLRRRIRFGPPSLLPHVLFADEENVICSECNYATFTNQTNKRDFVLEWVKIILSLIIVGWYMLHSRRKTRGKRCFSRSSYK
jgi:hypothetical protein